ncbi:MAG TPA: zinc-binding alcohol dehydrogenase family protein [Burkholderiaceae bacterium]
MKAVALTHYLPVELPESLFDTELPKPVAQGRDLLVAVQAVSVNPLDNRVRRPKDKVEPAPRVLGWDAAGIVEAVGPDVTQFKAGDAVYYAGDLNRPGSNAQYQLVDERLVGRKPLSMDFEHAAALPLAGLTAWEALFDRMRIPSDGSAAGKTMLILGAAGGVGTLAVQLAAKVAKLNVIGSASRDASKQWVRQMGAQHVIDHRADIALQLKELGHPEVDYVLVLADTAGYFPVAAEVVAPQGTIGLAVELTQPVDLGLLWGKSVTLAWEMVFTRIEYQTHDLAAHHAILNRMADLADAGVLVSPVTDVVAPINGANLRSAHARLAEGRQIGKIALKGF